MVFAEKKDKEYIKNLYRITVHYTRQFPKKG